MTLQLALCSLWCSSAPMQDTCFAVYGTWQELPHALHNPPYLPRYQQHMNMTYILSKEHNSLDLEPCGLAIWREPQLILASLSTQLMCNGTQYPGAITHTWLSKSALLLPSTSNIFASVLSPGKYCLSKLYFSLLGTTLTNHLEISCPHF